MQIGAGQAPPMIIQGEKGAVALGESCFLAERDAESMRLPYPWQTHPEKSAGDSQVDDLVAERQWSAPDQVLEGGIRETECKRWRGRMEEQMLLRRTAGERKDAFSGDKAVLGRHHDHFRPQRRAVPAERAGLPAMGQGSIVHEVFRWLERRAYLADAQLAPTKHAARRMFQRRTATLDTQSFACKFTRRHWGFADATGRDGKILP